MKKEFKARANGILAHRADLIRRRVPEYSDEFSGEPIHLASSRDLPAGYEAGHAFGKTYNRLSIPDIDELAADLGKMVGLYLTLLFRGGTSPIDIDGNGQKSQTLEERRRYVLHRTIERNGKASQAAKKALGYVCQACNFDFEKWYGAHGEHYIEAHHIVPLSDLPIDEVVTIDPSKDMAVLCANCHRMIHRQSTPNSIEEFSAIIEKRH